MPGCVPGCAITAAAGFTIAAETGPANAAAAAAATVVASAASVVVVVAAAAAAAAFAAAVPFSIPTTLILDFFAFPGAATSAPVRTAGGTASATFSAFRLNTNHRFRKENC